VRKFAPLEKSLMLKTVSMMNGYKFYADDWDDERSYDEYGGYNGYDDFTIDDAFEGDPDATWNVD
jgi:hypothetical protein